MQSAKVLRLKILSFCCITLVVFFVGCEQRHRDPRFNAATLPSCDADEMAKLNDISLNIQDESDICHIMSAQLQRNPPTFLLQHLFQLVAYEKAHGTQQNSKDIATKTMELIKEKHQEADDEAIYDTFRSVDKTYQR